ncbi:hypothetical protein IAQ61_001453 [Plenodomus lingam]|uniref:uncharacterized protein n=1 Tax=Leptosphaeria maculans TaxID=5022 RepID=UPI00331B573E|nr:hypothetical protein IAQ61_001453 [Plenodomus lingam]
MAQQQGYIGKVLVIVSSPSDVVCYDVVQSPPSSQVHAKMRGSVLVPHHVGETHHSTSNQFLTESLLKKNYLLYSRKDADFAMGCIPIEPYLSYTGTGH